MEPLTSDNFPIQVNFIPQEVTKLAGQIGMTFAPGKRHQGMHALWRRNLEQDLARLRNHYGTDLLVSLIEAHELKHLNIPNLFEQIRANKMQSKWFPIQDFGTPSSMQELIELVELILATAKQGKTIVVHCRAGLGRSGLVIAACLVALGYSPKEAFTIVRQARPGSVETEEQEAYVYKFAQAWRAA